MHLYKKLHSVKDYESIMEALADLKQRGYTVDLNLVFRWLRPQMPLFSLSPDRFQITERYSFEGGQPAGGDAVVYAIESTDGFKGILVTGFYVSTGADYNELIKDLILRN
jgi:hypothetical protein